MAYEVGQDILDNEINGFIGSGGTVAYASQVAVDAAAPCVGAVYGVGFGNRGYGQTGVTLTPVVPGQLIASTEWTDMRNALAVIREHQTGSVPALVPPTTELEVTDIIQAHESGGPTLDTYDFDSEISSGDSNRFTADASKVGVVVTTGTSSNTRGSTWGAGVSSIILEFDVNFGTENDARYFFNSDGEVRIDLSHPLGTPQDDSWNAALGTKLGQVRFGYTATSSTGTSGLSSIIGFYDLTGTYQTIIDGTNIGSGSYTINDMLIEAHRLSFAGINGGNGTGVRFRITLTDEHANVFSDIVSAGTTAAFTVSKATFLAGIVTPTGSVITPF
jgi:hypothetical protein